MSNLDQLSNVAYKKGNWMRFTLWGIGAVCIAILFANFIATINKDASTISAPEGYKFSVTNNYHEGSTISTTYYVYQDNKIIVRDESTIDDHPNISMLIYDGINTSPLELDENDTIEICELGACSEKPKIIAVIKNLISRKLGREYIGL